MRRVAEMEQGFYERLCSEFPESHVGNVRISGCDAFRGEVVEALSWLQSADPYGYSLVQRYLRGVVESAAKRKGAQVLGVRYQRSTEAGRLPSPRNRIAAAFVHDAAVARFIRGFGLVRSRRRELAALKRERKAMELLNCHPFYFQWQHAQIEERGHMRQRPKRSNHAMEPTTSRRTI